MRKHNCSLLFAFIVTIIILRSLFLSSEIQDTINSSPIDTVIIRHVLPSISKLPLVKCIENDSIQSFPKFNMQTQNMKDFLTYRHCRSFQLLLDSPMKCGGPNASKDIFLLLAIKSSPANYERREIIRKTWGEEKTFGHAKVKRIFFIGVSRAQEDAKWLMQLLAIESQTYGDILQWRFQDTFYNLTLKQVLFLQWQNHRCPGVQFIFNGDDDVFVHTFNVITYLQSLENNGSHSHLFVGALNIGMPPVRENKTKYYIPKELFPGEIFPPYCSGGGILMSGFTSYSILRASEYIPLFPIDDAYLGMCLEKAGISPGNHQGMLPYGIRVPGAGMDSFDPCYYQDKLMIHRFVPHEILILWKTLQITKQHCYTNTMTVSKITD
ncbi:acetylgalactosaminyl-O-glycosyl-glycoprotein beta-1,3-N-acetylglucosaminyltransferase-like [Pseudophryne corroboree]|uniref:acetylgalactosaminyl-O-glycosyl-glycoprotein beta-1,3-N-acetylglucosaminyltransferase-like n=1 Tax=Pseudophryne corroboree TaxID=495146 RepID=UPI0030813920